MMDKIIIKRVILVFVLIGFIFSYKLSFTKKNYNYMYKKYQVNYKKKYHDLLNNYDILKDNYTFIPTEIINISNKKINSIFLINKGTLDSVKENSYVVDANGLVGIVVKVYKKFSVVKLITSANISIAVEVNNCFGTLNYKNNKGYIDDLIDCKNVKVNDPVFTSKYSLSSSNIIIGKISKIQSNRIYIKYKLNPYKIRYLGVVYDTY